MQTKTILIVTMDFGEPITYELILGRLQSEFKDFVVKIKSGPLEPYVHVKTPHFSVTFNVWYSARDRTIEVTDGSITCRDRTKPIINYSGPLWRKFSFEFNRLKKREIRRKLEQYLQREFF
jgi:hypothetical protein